MKYFKKLVGEHIYLSPTNVEDVEKYTEWLNDFETTDYIGKSGYLVTLGGEREWVENNNKGDNVNSRTFAIVDLERDELIGNCGLHSIDPIGRTATLGIFIGDKSYRDKGYGTEIIKILLDYGFNYLNLNNIALTLMEFNERAYRCYQKCGFKEYGRKRKCIFVDGKYYDKICMDILAEEFEGNFIKNKNI